MLRRILFLTAVCVAPLWNTGCAQLGEQNTIEKFTAALQQEDMNSLRAMSSSRFETQALRLDESIDDLRILKLPKDPPTVVKIEEVSESEKNVTVETEGSGKRLLYRLVLDPQNKKWVVDDIYMKQKKRGVQVTRSVTEQMNLLLSVREFVDQWQQADRASVIRLTTPDLGALLEQLPPSALAQMTAEISGSTSKRFKPEAQLDEDAAVVRLPRDAGEVLISWKLLDDRWLVDDVSLKRRRNDKSFSGSIRRQAEIVLATTRFLDAYAQGDKEQLKQHCTPGFFRGALLPSNLSLVGLPSSSQLGKDYEIRGSGVHLYVVIPRDEEFVQVDLLGKGGDEDDARELRVDDVTLYDTHGAQQRRLSSVFTSRARLLICQEALQRNDLKLLKRLSTADLTTRVWNKLTPELAAQLPFGAAADPEREVLATNFHGGVTEIVTRAGGEDVAWLLSEVSGQLLLDDIRVQTNDMPASLKTRFELLIPAARFMQAILTNDARALPLLTSDDFNRLVWKHTRTIPRIEQPLQDLLRAPLQAVKIRGNNAAIVLGDTNYGTRLAMKRQRDAWVVDDVQMIAGASREQRTHLKQSFRLVLAEEMRAKSRPEDVLANLPEKPQIEIEKLPKQPTPVDWLDEEFAPTSRGGSGVTHAAHVVPAAEHPRSAPSQPRRSTHSAGSRSERFRLNDRTRADPASARPAGSQNVKRALHTTQQTQDEFFGAAKSERMSSARSSEKIERVVDPALSPIDIPLQ